MRKKLIAGNWKMNLNVTDTRKMLSELVEKNLNSEVEALICPPFTSLEAASEILKGTNIKLGAQNVSEYEDGARTGEISTNMLKDLSVSYVIIGHSERRTYYGETDEIVNEKIKRTLSQNLKAVLCVGEDEVERRENRHEEVVKSQLEKGLREISENTEDIVIAYEPIWAIGTGNTCSSEDAESMCKFIRSSVANIFSSEIADNMRILYGGSVKPSNVRELMSNENIDGALVGGASLKAEDFQSLVNFGE
ncbi:triosephosphate isomerase [Anaerosphaera aminiphila DSM 21120]|uniref:Triosephosphate isomerase n=1 Tax=Anaerosphaera aminiphila DSM 21120 TaxID=1120995 RepID=A0A1M5ULT0_9FIRM|nr:triose-phosphate isomerase [Anaerosphaera aminiphila]SHH63857.1 triosephosphate isomerase [Anaerosphaera aminiphila DSM 21120]